MTFKSRPYSAIPWSYSSLKSFEECPRRFYLIRVKKLAKDRQGPELAEGNKVHKALELYVGSGVTLPADYLQYKPIADKIRVAPGRKLVEHEFALTKALTPTGYWDSDAWVRGKYDVAVIRDTSGTLLDWKNGKRKVDAEQLKLFAASGFHTFPRLERIDTAYVWLASSQMDKETFVRDDAVPIWQEFAIRVHRLEEAMRTDNFPPRPSGLCKRYCPVGKRLCDYCGE